jgi:dinuclear metal center YbgI/SA1388 family protein
VDYGLSLYASHLPLDLHPRLGNNACLARALGLQELKPFGLYHGQTIGCGGKLLRGMNLRQLQQKFSKVLGRNPQAYHFGNPRIRRVAIVSGNASDLAVEAADQGYDAFITGELGHSAYHVCKEAGINILAGGHYATETFGVKILAQALGKKYSIPSVFLDIPTGL